MNISAGAAAHALLHGPVVVGIDGSAEATRAATYGAWEAARRRVPLRLVFAHQPMPMWGAGSLMFGDFASDADWIHEILSKAMKGVVDHHHDLPVEAVSISGGPAGILVDESTRASLVVVGTRASKGLSGHLAGSIAAQVASHASAPVVVMRGDSDDPAVLGGRPVVVGLDGSVEAEQAMAFAVDAAVARQVELHTVFAWNVMEVHDIGPIIPDSFDISGEQAKADRLLAEATAGWSQRYPDLVIVNRAEHEIDAVSALVREGTSASLIVVGSRGHGGFLGLRLGSTVDGLIRSAPAPVAVVRGDYPGQR